jgi:hypothetical protein
MSELRQIVIGFSMLQYGHVMAWGRQPKLAERPALPSGESSPPLEYWLELLPRCQTIEEVAELILRANAELEAWRRRPEPPPEGETFDDLRARIIDEGEGWTPHEVALAMRVTPTLVRNVRSEAERDGPTAASRMGSRSSMLAFRCGRPLRSRASRSPRCMMPTGRAQRHESVVRSGPCR